MRELNCNLQFWNKLSLWLQLATLRQLQKSAVLPYLSNLLQFKLMASAHCRNKLTPTHIDFNVGSGLSCSELHPDKTPKVGKQPSLVSEYKSVHFGSEGAFDLRVFWGSWGSLQHCWILVEFAWIEAFGWSLWDSWGDPGIPWWCYAMSSLYECSVCKVTSSQASELR